ncbi:hypothetical protein [Pseudoalteromonas spongiae]|uniref:hypothetical protein n=1 Tax=Pseudoalteromonas spongiae TaxID=298657 RepID=UPI000C985DD7|nr:hypothetical protein [Pseudoalteromonas spongiae]MAD98322.1 hypothetical protein [Flavobacteriaceae bacterium]TMO88893.1 hypothetical protein CWC15_00065 [Pseudoalteromonas spongiae]|tara:strand:+ start:1538 stop:2404 length:867 start_codon:yes stop_codon:yes gene_type:complete
MNKLKKSITVRFFSIEAENSFFSEFVSNYQANQNNDNQTRIINIRNKKHLLKASNFIRQSDSDVFPVTVVRERNTWQTKATSDGKISSIAINQGIIGDPYFFSIIPKLKVVIGFTSGPSVSLKSVGTSLLEQFCNNRSTKVKLELIPKEKEFSRLTEIDDYSSLHFKIGTTSLSDVAENAPQLIRDLSSAPYLESNMQLALDFAIDEKEDTGLSKENVIEIVNYLSNHDDCTLLKVKGKNEDGSVVHLDFGNAFINYKTEITTRHKYIDEKVALEILEDALANFKSLD